MARNIAVPRTTETSVLFFVPSGKESTAEAHKWTSCGGLTFITPTVVTGYIDNDGWSTKRHWNGKSISEILQVLENLGSGCWRNNILAFCKFEETTFFCQFGNTEVVGASMRMRVEAEKCVLT